MSDFQEIADNLSFLDDWEDRYKYIIELGQALPPLPQEAQIDENKVNGCVSKVWVVSETYDEAGQPHLKFEADSDAMIVKGIIAVLVSLFSGMKAQDIVDLNAIDTLDELGLREHLTAQRSNGLVAMVDRMKTDAKAAL